MAGDLTGLSVRSVDVPPDGQRGDRVGLRRRDSGRAVWPPVAGNRHLSTVGLGVAETVHAASSVLTAAHPAIDRLLSPTHGTGSASLVVAETRAVKV